jgi:purine-binding chemotaxis protein CheW
MASGTSVSERQFLSFQVAGEEYAVGILRVREIIEYGTITRVPSTPAWVRGVFNLRGGVVPVVDLAVKFGLPSAEITSRTCIVIVEVRLGGETSLMGVVADAVSQVLELSSEEIEPPPAFGTKVRLEYLQGMAKSGRKFVLLLEIDRVLSSDEIVGVTELARDCAEDGAGEGPEAATSLAG